MELDGLRTELHRRNQAHLPRFLAIEARMNAGETLLYQDCRQINAAIECASATLALGDSDRSVIILARRILLLCDALTILDTANRRRLSVVEATDHEVCLAPGDAGMMAKPDVDEHIRPPRSSKCSR